jgi:hypothetical protein
MRTDQRGLKFLAAVLLFSCCVIPLSHASDETQPPSRQQLVSVLNLEGESSAATVIQNNGVIEFQGNELVSSIAKTMATSGSLPLDSTLASPRNLTSGMQGAAIPLALVEKDLQAGINIDTLMADATKIARFQNLYGNTIPTNSIIKASALRITPIGTGAAQMDPIGTGAPRFRPPPSLPPTTK